MKPTLEEYWAATPERIKLVQNLKANIENYGVTKISFEEMVGMLRVHLTVIRQFVESTPPKGDGGE